MINFTHLCQTCQKIFATKQGKKTFVSLPTHIRILIVRKPLAFFGVSKSVSTNKVQKRQGKPSQADQPDPRGTESLVAKAERWFYEPRIHGLSVALIVMLVVGLISLHADIIALVEFYTRLKATDPPIMLLPNERLSSEVSATATPILKPSATPTVLPVVVPSATLVPTMAPLPTATPTPIFHEVEAGQNFSCLAQHYFGNPKYATTICYYNYEQGRIGEDCNELQTGEILIIPTERESTRLPPLLTTPGVRGKDYYCTDGETPVPTLSHFDSPLVSK